MNYIFYEIICIALHSIQVPNFRTQELFNPLAGENSPEMWKFFVEMWKKSVRNVEEIQTHHRIPPSCQWLLHWDSALSLKISFSRNIKIQNIKNLKKKISLNHIFIYISHRKSCERFPTFPIFIERSLWMLKNCSLSFWRSGHASSSIWLNVLKVKMGLPLKEEYSTLYGGFRKSGSQSSGTAKNKIDDSLFHLFIQFGHDLSKNCSRGCDMRSM